MNQQQENRFNSMYAAQTVLNDNSALWSGMPAMVALKSEFDANIASIEDAIEVQVKDIKGHTVAKADALEAMIAKTLRVGGAVMAYAGATKNAGLAEEMNVVPSELRGYRDAIVAQRCQGIHAAATTNLAALVGYGVVAADLTELQTLIDAYVALVPKPRNMIVARSVKTGDLGLLLRDTSRLLDRRMDMMMRSFMVSAPDFYSQYTKARMIVDLGGSGEAEEAKVA